VSVGALILIVIVGALEVVGGALMVMNHERVDAWYGRSQHEVRRRAIMWGRDSRRSGYILILIGSIVLFGAALLAVTR